MVIGLISYYTTGTALRGAAEGERNDDTSEGPGSRKRAASTAEPRTSKSSATKKAKSNTDLHGQARKKGQAAPSFTTHALPEDMNEDALKFYEDGPNEDNNSRTLNASAHKGGAHNADADEELFGEAIDLEESEGEAPEKDEQWSVEVDNEEGEGQGKKTTVARQFHRATLQWASTDAEPMEASLDERLLLDAAGLDLSDFEDIAKAPSRPRHTSSRSSRTIVSPDASPPRIPARLKGKGKATGNATKAAATLQPLVQKTAKTSDPRGRGTHSEQTANGADVRAVHEEVVVVEDESDEDGARGVGRHRRRMPPQAGAEIWQASRLLRQVVVILSPAGMLNGFQTDVTDSSMSLTQLALDNVSESNEPAAPVRDNRNDDAVGNSSRRPA
ncbi:hypothetical protein FA95DRAFT_1613751 [Auriscalpium vulgare]|uniref:Uncharacterized protein n=1 Tax=Auriscalpium vulgare TaxID=40419 RepID=A0ACB8R254_9AGAM|nr:hypothetical protein FA95DRAFT_1613751 [Auriscalpium vulgare]